MELRHLKYFIAVAEEKNIGRAAVRLHISQPPLSRQIKQLEDELDTVLFIRTPHGMELTEAGKLFLEESRNVQSVIERATEKTRRAGRGELGRLDVAIFGTGIFDTIPKLLRTFSSEFPNIKVVLHSMDKEEQIKALLQRRICVGFNRYVTPPPGIARELVTTENMVLAVNEKDELAKESVVSARVLGERPLVLFPNTARPNSIDRLLSIFHSIGITPRIGQEVGDAITGLALIAAGFGICLVPTSVTKLSFPGVVFRPIEWPRENFEVDLTCIYRDDDQSPTLLSFLETIRKCRKSGMLIS